MAKLTGKIGLMAGWSYPYVGGRPREVLKITEAVEANCSQFWGWSAKDAEGNSAEHFEIEWGLDSAPTVTDFANTPIGTIIWTPELANIAGYQHQAQSSPAVVGDWASIAKTTVT